VRQRLAQTCSLSAERRANPSLDPDDLCLLFYTLWTSCEITDPQERQRTELAFAIQLMSYTGNLPSAVLSIKYRDIKMSLLRVPGVEHPRLLLEFKFPGFKKSKNPAALNEFVLPIVPHDTRLLFCPHVMVLGLAFADGSFRVPRLTTIDDLLRLRIPAETVQLSLPWRQNLQNDHSSRVLQPTRNYIPTDIFHDTMALFRGLPAQDAIIMEATGMRRTVDTRRPKHLPEMERVKLNEDTQLQFLKLRHSYLIRRVQHYKQLLPKASGQKILKEKYKSADARKKRAEREYNEEYNSLYALRLAEYQDLYNEE
ncbi:MAG: hypothetical protein Q9164_005125, partial [Protoblastenia rupestris]